MTKEQTHLLMMGQIAAGFVARGTSEGLTNHELAVEAQLVLEAIIQVYEESETNVSR